MSRVKTTCPICAKPMALGRRVRVNLSWERSTSFNDVESRFVIVCRKCATKLSHMAGLEVPVER